MNEEEEKLKHNKIKRIMYITIILVFIFIIAWISGIAGKIIY